LNSKIIAVAIVAILVVAGVGAYFLLQGGQEKDKEINVLAQVNTDGSGIYIDEKIKVSDLITFDAYGIPTYHPEGWGGLVFGTPGIATIQHVQLLQISESMGLKFSAYTLGAEKKKDTVYFVTGISNAVLALGSDIIDGGTLWQPQYQKIVEDKRFKPLALTNDLFPGHACCIIAGSHAYTSTHADETERFLAAYVKAVWWVQDALDAGSGEDYDQLIELAQATAGANFTKSEVIEALYTVVYTFGAHSVDNPLAHLKSQIASLADDMVELNVVNRTLKDLGFKNGAEFADKFIDGRYLSEAFKIVGDGGKYEGKLTDIKVAVISGDIHQIAVHVAIAKGYFNDFGLNVTLSPAVNGPGVATAIQNGEASFGLLGAPPITITVINGELVKA
jgi:ABC-type nitrate/sulfonate/bicarbonate transport system substrate-binding protein